MKVLKNFVRNRHRPESYIAENYIVEQAVEFLSKFLFGVDPIGLDSHKLRAYSDNSNIGKPLSTGVPLKPEK